MKLPTNLVSLAVNGLAVYSAAGAPLSRKGKATGQGAAAPGDSLSPAARPAQPVMVRNLALAAPRAPAGQPAQVVFEAAQALSFPIGRRLTAADFQLPEVVARTGQQIAFSQKDAEVQHNSAADLFTFQDAMRRLHNVASCAEKSKAVALDLDQAEHVVTYLGAVLKTKAVDRIFAVYNYYPQGMKFDENENLHLKTDGDNRAFHAEFEPLNRLGFSARLDHARLHALYDAYQNERAGRKATNEELFASGQCKYLFDLLYLFYFVDEAFVGGRNEADKQAYLGAANAQLSRLRADQQVTVDAQMPRLALPEHIGN